MTTESSPRIYVACLAAYNNGHLHGRWIDADQEADAIWQEIRDILATSPIPEAEEHAIHDYEGFGKYQPGEYESIETIVALAAFISEHGDMGSELLEYFGGDLEAARSALESYAGEHRSLAEFAEYLTCETSEVPEHLASYIDYDAMGRDMELNGDVFTLETGFEQVHVFWRH